MSISDTFLFSPKKKNYFWGAGGLVRSCISRFLTYIYTHIYIYRSEFCFLYFFGSWGGLGVRGGGRRGSDNPYGMINESWFFLFQFCLFFIFENRDSTNDISIHFK